MQIQQAVRRRHVRDAMMNVLALFVELTKLVAKQWLSAAKRRDGGS